VIKIYEKLFVGDNSDCFYEEKPGWVIIHACKHPCHQKAMGYRGNLKKTHPNYLIFQRKSHLFLNMVDMNRTLSHVFTEPIISKTLAFIENNIMDNNVLIHCNRGYSRSPALALLFLAKKKNVLSNASYEKAKSEFIDIFSEYIPGRGIDSYLNLYWNELS
jgi:hypothetical protein